MALRPRSEVPYVLSTEGLIQTTHPLIDREPERRVHRERRRAVATVQEAEELPGLVLFRDSFASQLLPYLAWAARRGAYYWQYFLDPAVIDRERPDVVVQEIGERSLLSERIVPPAAAVHRDFWVRRLFRNGEPVSVALAEGFAPAGEGVWSLRFVTGDAEGRDLVLRIDLDAPAGGELRLVRAGGEPVLERSLELRREIVYARLPEAGPREHLELRIEGPDGAEGAVVLRTIEASARR